MNEFRKEDWNTLQAVGFFYAKRERNFGVGEINCSQGRIGNDEL